MYGIWDSRIYVQMMTYSSIHRFIDGVRLTFFFILFKFFVHFVRFFFLSRPCVYYEFCLKLFLIFGFFFVFLFILFLFVFLHLQGIFFLIEMFPFDFMFVIWPIHIVRNVLKICVLKICLSFFLFGPISQYHSKCPPFARNFRFWRGIFWLFFEENYVVGHNKVEL